MNKYLQAEKQFFRKIRSRFLSTIAPRIVFKKESTRKSSNIYLSWTKIEYQNNLSPIALFSTLKKKVKM